MSLSLWNADAFVCLFVLLQAYADLISDCAKVKELEFAYAGCDDGEANAQG